MFIAPRIPKLRDRDAARKKTEKKSLETAVSFAGPRTPVEIIQQMVPPVWRFGFPADLVFSALSEERGRPGSAILRRI